MLGIATLEEIVPEEKKIKQIEVIFLWLDQHRGAFAG